MPEWTKSIAFTNLWPNVLGKPLSRISRPKLNEEGMLYLPPRDPKRERDNFH